MRTSHYVLATFLLVLISGNKNPSEKSFAIIIYFSVQDITAIKCYKCSYSPDAKRGNDEKCLKEEDDFPSSFEDDVSYEYCFTVLNYRDGKFFATFILYI